jgi:hypothetical protein
MTKLLRNKYPLSNINFVILILVFLFSFFPKIKLLLISDLLIAVHLIFLCTLKIKKKIIEIIFFENQSLLLWIFFLLFYFFSIINLLFFNENNIVVDLKIFRLLIYFIYVTFLINLLKENLKKFNIINYYQIIIIIFCLISWLFILNNIKNDNIFFSRDALWQNPLGYRIVDLSGYSFNLDYIGNTVNSFSTIIFFALVVYWEKYLVNKKKKYFILMLFLFISLIATSSQSGLLSLIIYFLFRIFIFFSKKYNFLISIFFLILFFFIIHFCMMYLIENLNFYLFGIDRIYGNLIKIISNIQSDNFHFPGTIGDRFESYRRFIVELTLNPKYILIGYGLFNDNHINENFILESSILFSLFYGGFIIFIILNIFFIFVFFQSYKKIDYDFNSKIIFFTLPSFYLINFFAFQAIFNISIFIFFWTLYLLSIIRK